MEVIAVVTAPAEGENVRANVVSTVRTEKDMVEMKMFRGPAQTAFVVLERE